MVSARHRAWVGWRARGTGAAAQARWCCGGGHAAVADARENPVGDEAGLDAGGVGGAADGGHEEGVRRERAIGVVFGGEIPGCFGPGEQAEEQGEDQGREPGAEVRARACCVGPKGDAQAGEGDGLGAG